MPGPGLGAVRVWSFLTANDQVEIPFAALRIPTKGAHVDNLHQGAMAVPVDVVTGTLGVAVGNTSDVPIWHEIQFHPETGAVFTGCRVPFWAEALSTIRTAALVFRDLPALGWDIAICPDGPVLIETNWEFGTAIAEKLTNRGWANDLRASFARCRRWETSEDA